MRVELVCAESAILMDLIGFQSKSHRLFNIKSQFTSSLTSDRKKKNRKDRAAVQKLANKLIRRLPITSSTVWSFMYKPVRIYKEILTYVNERKIEK